MSGGHGRMAMSGGHQGGKTGVSNYKGLIKGGQGDQVSFSRSEGPGQGGQDKGSGQGGP